MADAVHHNHGCDACARACSECKTNVTKLEKKNFKLAIALTSALTLLGEQGVRAVVGVVESMRQVSDPAPAAEKKTASAGGSGYQFGGPGRGLPPFSGWKPSWQGDADPVSALTFNLPEQRWSGQRPLDGGDISAILSTSASMPQSYLSVAHIGAVEKIEPIMPPPGTLTLAGVSNQDMFVTPSPFGGYRAHLEPEPSQVSNIPGPGPLCVFAVGGLFGSRSRA